MATSLLAGFGSSPLTVARHFPAPAILLAVAGSPERSKLGALLRDWGHPVAEAADGAALFNALEQPRAAPVVILDLELPGFGGMALLHRLQSAGRRSWTILLGEPPAAAGGPALAHRTGIDDLLAKPVDEFELRVSLRTASRVKALDSEMADAIDAAHYRVAHDPLTGLLNREALLHKLFQETDRVQRAGSRLAFLLLDLDRFSRVNREHGYDAGDRILRQLASRLRRFLRSYDTAGRLGGNQFLIAMPGYAASDGHNLAVRLRDCIAERPFDVLQTKVGMTASFGIAISGGRSPLTVLREAEGAMVGAKLLGGGGIRCFPSTGIDPEGMVNFDHIKQSQRLNGDATSVPA